MLNKILAATKSAEPTRWTGGKSISACQSFGDYFSRRGRGQEIHIADVISTNIKGEACFLPRDLYITRNEEEVHAHYACVQNGSVVLGDEANLAVGREFEGSFIGFDVDCGEETLVVRTGSVSAVAVTNDLASFCIFNPHPKCSDVQVTHTSEEANSFWSGVVFSKEFHLEDVPKGAHALKLLDIIVRICRIIRLAVLRLDEFE
mmetsp:Transcript_32797/g.96679  ORF Transcript_32797/g.96679 Transcript_32797/m.96679 type:complete len:204 (+) Transcript_32797:1146-1757(+)